MTMKHKVRIVFFLAGVVMLSTFFLWLLLSQYEQTSVVFLNVGQGDAILLSQGSYQVLIDGGRSGKDLLARLGRHVPFWDRKIEVVIATHPDADHIGGLSSLLRAYQVDQVFTTGAESETETWRLFRDGVVKSVGHEPTTLFRGGTIEFPAGGKLSVEYPLTPLPKAAADTNEGSIVARFVYGETSFLLTGDLPREETVLPDEAPVSVLKVAHHGSKYSTSASFLDRIKPEEAVLSVGKNSYGHPDPSVVERLQQRGTRIHRTDQEGDIRYRCLQDLQRCYFLP